MPFVVAIVGRANVGKSTLLNKLSGKKFAITNDTPGVTRDRKEIECEMFGMKFTLVDTAGLEMIPKGSLPSFVRDISDKKKKTLENEMYEQMIKQSLNAIKDADLVIFVTDGRGGVQTEDVHFAKMVNKISQSRKILVCNKCENDKTIQNILTLGETRKLSLGDPIFISAEHGIGLSEIYEIIIQEYDKNKDEYEEEERQFKALESSDKIHISIIGRPNAGKSSLVNTILGYERLIVGDKPGITRDSISVDFTHNDTKLKIIDTAGIRKKVRSLGEKLEKLSIEETMRNIRLCHVCVLVVDVTDPFVTQDISIASNVIKEGRNLIVALNKWDLLTKEEQGDVKESIKNAINALIIDVSDTATVFTSAKSKIGIKKLLSTVIQIYTNWNKRIKTSTLNQWLPIVQNSYKPPLYNKRQIKLKYMTQIKTRPPTFNLHVNIKNGISDQYIKYLKTRIAEDFDLKSVPIRISVSESKNPFVKDVKGKKQKRMS